MKPVIDGRKNAGMLRRERICELLLDHGYLDVSALSDQLGVNTVTIRRDLDRLEASGMLRRSHGGAYAQPSPVGAELDFSIRMNYHSVAKTRIAHAAANLIEEGDTVYLDAGTTALLVAEELAKRQGISVVTHSLEAAHVLQSNKSINLFVIGGQYFSSTRCMVGPAAEESIRGYRFRKMILATAGIDFRSQALTLSSIEEVPIKRAAIMQSERVILVADQSKFDKPALISMIPLTHVHQLVSDTAPSREVKDVLDKLNISVVLT